jgi:hypothetical protein
MKHVLVGVLLLTGVTAFAQEKGENRRMEKERIEQAKIAFITNKLELTADQAKEFWPIYDAMAAELKEHRKSLKEELKSLKGEDAQKDDASYKKVFDNMHEGQLKGLDIKTKYTNQIGELLGYEKVFTLGEAEKDFKKRLMDRMKNAKDQKRGGPSGQGGPPNKRSFEE